MRIVRAVLLEQITFIPVHPIPYHSLPHTIFMDPIIARIRQELTTHADPEIQKISRRYFKEAILCYGMKTATGIAIARKYWKEVKGRPKPEIFALCEELYQSGYMGVFHCL